MKNAVKVFLILPLLIWASNGISFAQALNFGAYSYITIGTVLQSNQSYTKEAWVRVYPTQAKHGRNFISAYDHPFWLEDGHLSAANKYGLYPRPTVQDPDAFPLNTWVHIAVTYDAHRSIMTLYKNGKIVAADSMAVGYDMGVMQLGATGSGDFLDGTDMEEVSIWGIARTQAQLISDMNCDVKGKDGLLAYYKFDEGKPNDKNTGIPAAVDYSGHAYSGIFSNFAFTGSSNNYVKGRTDKTTAPITGAEMGCTATSVTLTDATTGGIWSSSNPAVAAVSRAGVLTSLTVGTTVISYAVPNGCAISKTLNVYASPSIEATTTSESSDGGGNGSIKVIVSGGRPSYTYSWSNGATTPELTDLKEGRYNVTVTDVHGCKATGAYIITRPAEANYSINLNHEALTAAKQP